MRENWGFSEKCMFKLPCDNGREGIFQESKFCLCKTCYSTLCDLAFKSHSPHIVLCSETNTIENTIARKSLAVWREIVCFLYFILHLKRFGQVIETKRNAVHQYSGFRQNLLFKQASICKTS